MADDVRSDDRRRVVSAGIQRVGMPRSRTCGPSSASESRTWSRPSSRSAGIVSRSLDPGIRRQAARGIRSSICSNMIEIDTDGRIVATRRVRHRRPRRRLRGARRPIPRRRSGRARGHVGADRGGLAALNRRELPSTTPDWVNIDHRLGTAFAPGDLIAYIGAAWDLARIRGHIEAVHRLSNLGAVFTHAIRGTSQEGFDAEWRQISLATVEGDLINRIEMFDEQTSTPRSRNSNSSPSAPRLENAANQVAERLLDQFAARDWNAITEILADDFFDEDRRPVVNAGIRYGRDVEIASMRAGADLGRTNITSSVIATRGERLILARDSRWAATRPEAFRIDVLAVIEIDADNRIVDANRVRPRQPRRRLRRARCPVPCRRSGGSCAHVVGYRGLYAAPNRRELPPRHRTG